MEGSPKQEPLINPITSKTTPDPNTAFGDDVFDYNAMPQKKFSAGGLNEWIFNKMRPKRKISAKPISIPIKNPIDGHELLPIFQPTPILTNPNALGGPAGEIKIPKGYELQNGLLIQKKSLAERVRDQIKFPVLKSSGAIINGATLILFAIGSIAIYSELPTHPGLVIGILVVALSANIIIGNR